MRTFSHIPILLLGLISLYNVVVARDLRQLGESLDYEGGQDALAEGSSIDLAAAASGHKSWKKGGGDEHHSDHHSSHGSKGSKGWVISCFYNSYNYIDYHRL